MRKFSKVQISHSFHEFSGFSLFLFFFLRKCRSYRKMTSEKVVRLGVLRNFYSVYFSIATQSFPENRVLTPNAFPRLSRQRCVFRKNCKRSKLLQINNWFGKNFQKSNFRIFHFPTFPHRKKWVLSKNSSNKSCLVFDSRQLLKCKIFRRTHRFPGKSLQNAFPRLSRKLCVFWENYKRPSLFRMENWTKIFWKIRNFPEKFSKKKFFFF